MTQDEIIRMAREAGGCDMYIPAVEDPTYTFQPDALERFAALVAAHEAKEHLKMLENLREETKAHCLQAMAEAYEMGKQDEREACAKLCEEFGEWRDTSGVDCAAAIRARSEK